MGILAAITFYGSLVFGFGFGLVAVFNVGRLGLTQVAYWAQGAAMLAGPLSREEGEAMLGLADVPTSGMDVLWSMTPIGWIKTFKDLVTTFYSHRGRQYSYYATLFGNAIGRLWFTVGLPCFFLDMVLSHEGHNYQPDWLAMIGSRQQMLLATTGYVLAYWAGTLVSSPQREFNRARITYEGIVADKGYWFDHRNSLGHYVDSQPRAALERCLRAYLALWDSLHQTARNRDMLKQRQMILHYQSALLYCTMRQYGQAVAATCNCDEIRLGLKGSTIWEPHEPEIFESQLKFLQGEIAIVQGRMEKATPLFQRSLAIDQSLPAEATAEAVWDRFIHPDDLPAVYAQWTSCLQSGEPYTIEFRVRRADGTYRWFLVRALPLTNADGSRVRWYGTCTDVHDQRAMQAEKEQLLDRERVARADAEAANHAKDRHLAFLAHELRGPLTPALLAAAAIAEDAALPDALRADAALIRRNIELTTRLADDLLDANRIALGKLELRVEPVDVHELLSMSLDMCAADAAARRVRVVRELRAIRPQVVGDAAKLTEVWTNLLKNAVKFSYDGGTVTVRTSDALGNRLRIEVQDAGVGVEADFLPRIFNLYEQGDRSVTREYSGLGLGLSICKGIVDAHCGTISAASSGKGCGTTLTVELPATLVGRIAEPIAPPTDVMAAAGLKILLVDDHEDTLRVMSRLLGKLKHRVTTATGVDSALSAFNP